MGFFKKIKKGASKAIDSAREYQANAPMREQKRIAHLQNKLTEEKLKTQIQKQRNTRSNLQGGSMNLMGTKKKKKGNFGDRFSI